MDDRVHLVDFSTSKMSTMAAYHSTLFKKMLAGPGKRKTFGKEISHVLAAFNIENLESTTEFRTDSIFPMPTLSIG